LTYQPYEGKIIYQKNLTDDLAIFRLELSDKSKILDFKPGQFVPLGVKIKDKVTYRAYSISSPPEERRYYEFYIRWATKPVLGKITSALFTLKKISSLSHSVVFLYFFALTTEEGFLISPCYSLELCIQMLISFLFSFAFRFSSFHSYL